MPDLWGRENDVKALIAEAMELTPARQKALEWIKAKNDYGAAVDLAEAWFDFAAVLDSIDNYINDESNKR